MIIGREKEKKMLREAFLEATGTQKSIHLTLITTRGLSPNAHSAIFQNVVGANTSSNRASLSA
jgi:hypothetical protein